MNSHHTPNVLQALFDRWCRVEKKEPITGIIYKVFESSQACGQLTVWIIDDAWPFGDKIPKLIGDDSAFVLAALDAALSHPDVCQVVASGQEFYTVEYLQKEVLGSLLSHRKVCLLLDLFGPGDDENLGSALVPTLVGPEPVPTLVGDRRNPEPDRGKVPFLQAALFTKRGDSETSPKLKGYIGKPAEIADARGLDSLFDQIRKFLEHCGNLHKSRYRKRAAEEPMRALARQCHTFHLPNNTHSVAKCIEDRKQARKYALELQNAIKKIVVDFKKQLASVIGIVEEKCARLFAPFEECDDNLLTALFSTSKAISLRAREGCGNVIPGYWLRVALNGVPADWLDRWALRVSDSVPFAAVLASFELLADRATGGIRTEGILATAEDVPKGEYAQFKFEFVIDDDPAQKRLEYLLGQINQCVENPVHEYEHSIQSAVAALLQAGFDVTGELANGGTQLIVRVQYPGTIEWPCFQV